MNEIHSNTMFYRPRTSSCSAAVQFGRRVLRRGVTGHPLIRSPWRSRREHRILTAWHVAWQQDEGVINVSKRYYTVKEVNDLIPDLVRQMTSLKETREAIAIKRMQVERARREQMKPASPDQFFAEETEIEFLLITARQQIEHLTRQSIEVKDIDAGLVDFLSFRDGQEMYLCWRCGEPNVRFWHSTEEGFSERKPISPEALT